MPSFNQLAQKTQTSLLARVALSLLSVLALTLSMPGFAFAGFGITPPYVNNDRLTRGSVYEQKIIMVRSDPTDDLKTDITMNVPGIEDWISIDKGNEFILPAGQTQVPVTITVRVPQNAPYKTYTGAIRVRTSAAGNQPTNGVSIALGAQIDVNLTVVDKIYDFEVRQVRVLDLEEGRTRFGLYFPGKIRFYMTIHNTGNTDFGPTKVCFDIYDANGENKLESTCNSNTIEKVPAFGMKEVLAEMPTRLRAGAYVAKYTIYKNDQIAQQNQLNISIGPPGSVPGYNGYGWGGLSLSDRLKVIAVIIVPVVFIIGFVYLLYLRRRRFRR